MAQEALLRLTRQEGPIDEPAAWMTTVATRLSINVLRSARARRESYVGPWLPEPLVEDPAPGPASRAELADSLSLALLVLLERLTPVERAAYLLREVFGYEYAEIADIIEQTEVNSRQLVTRARKHLEASRPRFDADEAARDALLERFLAAAEDGDLEALEELLAKDAVLYADSGGKAMAPQEPLFGAALIARFMAAVAQVRPASGEFESRRVRVNGQPGRVVRGPAEPPLGEAERLAAEKALALLKSGDVDAEQLAALVKDARDAAGRRLGPFPSSRPRSGSGACSRWMSSTAGSRPCASCATRTSSAISELSQGGRLRCQTCEQPNTTQEDSHVDSRSPALLGHLPRPAGALDLRVRGAPLRRLLVPRLAVGRRGDAARRRRRPGARGVRARRLHLRGRAGRDAGERARAGVLRRRAPSRDHVPLDGGPPRRRRPGGGRRRAHDPGRHAPGHRQRSLRPAAAEPASARSRDCSSGRASTAASSDSTGRWSCRAAATRSAGMSRWTSTCCSSERTRMPTGEALPSGCGAPPGARRPASGSPPCGP